jgi:DNA-binding CsgD family transcriptional regulator
MTLGASHKTSLLCPREMEAARLLHGGKNTKEIAHSMGLSYLSAKQYLASARAKLKLGTRGELMLWWERHVDPRNGNNCQDCVLWKRLQSIRALTMCDEH